MRLKVTLLSVWLLASIGGGAQVRGTLRGKVVDEMGKGISAATVKLLRLNPERLLHRDDKTDNKGEFIINGIPFGSYIVCAGKEEDGYPAH